MTPNEYRQKHPRCVTCEYLEEKEIKAEAYKEFAELVKANKITVDVSNGYGRATFTEAVTVLEIEHLLKEMVGEE